MRVLLVTEASSGGTGRHVMDLADGLLERGCDVHVAYSQLRVDEVFQSWLKQSEVKSCRMDMRRMPHLGDLTVIRQLSMYLRQYPCDLLHAHSSKAGIVTRLRQRSPWMRHVYTPHCIFTMNPSIKPLAYHITANVERWLARRCDAIVAVSPDEHRHLSDLGIPEQKIHYISNGLRRLVGDSQQDSRKQLGLPTDATIIGFLGRLSFQKDPQLLLRAFALLTAENDNLVLAMAGTGELEGECRELASQLRIEHAVHWLGFQTAERLLPAIDVFAMPSRYESMPYVLLEALGSGLPIVATRVGGTDLTVVHESNGMICPSHAPQDFAKALQPLLSRSRRQQFGSQSREMASQHTVESMVERTHELYRQLLGDRSITPAENGPYPAVEPAAI